MKLFKVNIDMPVYHTEYFVVASGFDEAIKMALEAESANEGRPGGVSKVEVVGSFGGDEPILLLSQRAQSEVVGGYSASFR
jgi:hypothetical protein